MNTHSTTHYMIIATTNICFLLRCPRACSRIVLLLLLSQTYNYCSGKGLYIRPGRIRVVPIPRWKTTTCKNVYYNILFTLPVDDCIRIWFAHNTATHLFISRKWRVAILRRARARAKPCFVYNILNVLLIIFAYIFIVQCKGRCNLYVCTHFLIIQLWEFFLAIRCGW